MATGIHHAWNWSVWYCHSKDIQLYQKERIQRQGKMFIDVNVIQGYSVLAFGGVNSKYTKVVRREILTFH